MKRFIVGMAVGLIALIGVGQVQAQHFHGHGGHRHHTTRQFGSAPVYPGGYPGNAVPSYYGGGHYGRGAHMDYVPGHYDIGRGYVPGHVDVHVGGRRYQVLPGGYVSPYHHHRD
jgi:hypothetical protein